jgi:hypothetical protein
MDRRSSRFIAIAGLIVILVAIAIAFAVNTH